MSWSQADAELLLSSAKDNQILCWNLGSSEVGWPFCGYTGMVGQFQLHLCALVALPKSGFPSWLCSLTIGGV